jgi:pyrroline-5-carboxylate reductase
MGSALLRSWAAGNVGPVAVVEPYPASELKTFARRHHIRILHSLENASEGSVGACVIAIKPQVLRAEAPRLRPVAESGALMVSIAAGTSIAALRRAWGRRVCIVRAMPNLPGAIGRGICALYAPRGISPAARERAISLLSGLGETVWVSREALIDVVTAVSGSGPAYVFLFAECLARSARTQGLPREVAERLARATIVGAGALLAADDRDPAALRRDVTSPGGTTEAALQVLMQNEALAKLVADAVAAARSRAAELRRQSEM